MRRRRGSRAPARDHRGHRPGGDDAARPTGETGEEPTTSTSRAMRPNGEEVYASRRVRRLPHARGRRLDRQRRPEPRRREARRELVVDRVTNGQGAMPSFEDQLERAADRGRRCSTSSSRPRLILPPGFPRDVAAFACDLDRTLIAEDGEPATAHDRRDHAPPARRASPCWSPPGACSAPSRRTREAAGIDDPVVCYQGAAVVDPRAGEFLLHEPMPLELAREAIAAVAARGLRPQLLRRRRALRRRAHGELPRVRRLPAPADHGGGRPARMARAAADEARRGRRARCARRAAAELAARFGDRLFITKSLPLLPRARQPRRLEGRGLAFVAEHLGFTAAQTVAFGDGENDVELLDVGRLRRRGRERRTTACRRSPTGLPGPEEEGVAQAIEAYLDSRA